MFEDLDIETLRNLSIGERVKVSQRIKEMKKLLVDSLVDIDDKLEQWIEEINQIYLPEYARSDYKSEVVSNIRK